MTTYNQRLYRVARSILRDDNEAEDAVQEAYVGPLRIWRAIAGKPVSQPGYPASS